MTVKELIEILSTFDSKDRVVFSYNYNDYWNNSVVEDVDDAHEGDVIFSEYHQQEKEVSNDGAYDDFNLRNVVILIGSKAGK